MYLVLLGFFTLFPNTRAGNPLGSQSRLLPVSGSLPGVCYQGLRKGVSQPDWVPALATLLLVSLWLVEYRLFFLLPKKGL